MSTDNPAEVNDESDEAMVGHGGSDGAQPALSGTGFTYRHDWGRRRGQQVLRLNLPGVDRRSHVFVSIGEGAAGGPDNGKFVGSARYTVHNVAPRPGGVDVWVNIEWGADISVYADYLVVNPPGMRTVSVTVHRHSTVAFSEAQADRVLRDMGTVLQNSDSTTDVATPVQFVRNGPVRVLPASVPATIQTQAELSTLFTAGTGVKVVQAIRYCGGPGGSIIGCAPVGSATVNMAVVPFTANQEGVLWAHEYGHNVGNGHRTDDGRALMFPSIGADHNVVNSTESGRFLSGPLALTGAAEPMRSSCGHGEVMQPLDDVVDFVTQHWIEGVPREAAEQYTEEDARRLMELLDEPGEHEEFLPEIVTTLCFIGSEVVVEPVIDFIRSPRAGRAVFNAKNAGLIHLGDLIAQTGNQTALEFLTLVASDMKEAEALSEPQFAAQAASDNPGPAPLDLGAELAVSATLGLSLAGTPEAKETIDHLKEAPDAFAAVNLAAAEVAESTATQDSDRA
jgi:hypothetical protein